ncbi:MAG TPA: UPF0175 family protein [Chthoniobacterales bacterium]
MKSLQEEPSRSTKSVVIPRFWEAYRQIPPDIRDLARYLLWNLTPEIHRCASRESGVIWSARIGDDYRALAVLNGDQLAKAGRPIEAQLIADLGLHCYQFGLISLGMAAEFSGLRRAEFEQLIAAHKIERPGSLECLDGDLDWARKGD